VFFAWTNRESWNPWQREQKHFIQTFCVTWHLQKGACSAEAWAWDHGHCVGSLGSGGGRTEVSKELCPYCWQSPPSTWLPCESARGEYPADSWMPPSWHSSQCLGPLSSYLLMSHLRALCLTVTVSCLELSRIGKQWTGNGEFLALWKVLSIWRTTDEWVKYPQGLALVFKTVDPWTMWELRHWPAAQ